MAPQRDPIVAAATGRRQSPLLARTPVVRAGSYINHGLLGARALEGACQPVQRAAYFCGKGANW
jgi:hypothetical protein